MSGRLVLSVFPGIDLLGRAFEEERYCVVRGPDLLWGGDIRGWHPPAGVFEGVIGGPPCQAFSALRHLIRHNGHEPKFGNLIPEYERVCFEAQPQWFLMENVPDAPIPNIAGYQTWACILRDKWVGGVQPRPRRFSFGTHDGRPLDIQWAALMRPETAMSVVAGHGLAPGQRSAVLASDSGIAYEERRRTSVLGDARIPSTADRVRTKGKGAGVLPHMGSVLPIADACEAMGLPRDFTKDMPFTMQGKRSVIGNGVPMAMGRAVADAVRRATQ